MRTEYDHIGPAQIPCEALYGIHAWRAQQNFPDTDRFSHHWYKAVGLVKHACYKTIKRFQKVAHEKFSEVPVQLIDNNKLDALLLASEEVAAGNYFEWFIVPAIQGGAGTSINMNVNEIIANAALQKLEHKPGNYNIIDPTEHANRYQSTNDVIPTALHVASMKLMLQLEEEINLLRHDIEKIETENRNSLRVAFTQMQQAVPSTIGRLFSTYNEALSRDWWRISRGQERLKVVNLGGSAIGSGITVPRFFIMEAVQQLQNLTGLPLTRSENMHDATCNLDAFVEAHGFLKAHAVTLEKMVSDLRLLSSDLISSNDLNIPQKQVGSSIMPAKINPVIPEYIISVAHKIYANDQVITQLAGQGMLDLNANLPLLGHAFLNSLELLVGANKTIKNNLIAQLVINKEAAHKKLFKSPAICTALLPYIGYHKAEKLGSKMYKTGCDVFEANQSLQLVDDDKLREILSPSKLIQEGFSLNDLK